MMTLVADYIPNMEAYQGEQNKNPPPKKKHKTKPVCILLAKQESGSDTQCTSLLPFPAKTGGHATEADGPGDAPWAAETRQGSTRRIAAGAPFDRSVGLFWGGGFGPSTVFLGVSGALLKQENK